MTSSRSSSSSKSSSKSSSSKASSRSKSSAKIVEQSVEQHSYHSVKLESPVPSHHESLKKQSESVKTESPKIPHVAVEAKMREIEEKDVSIIGEPHTFDYKNQKLHVPTVIALSFLLSAPFMMGQTINSLSNENPIRGFFAFQLGLANDLNSPLRISNDIWSIGFLYPFGGLVGALLGAFLIEEIGRKYSTLIFTQLMILGAVFKIISIYTHLGVLFLGRFFDGVAAAGLMVTGIMWMFDCLPRKIENYYKPMIQVTVMVGIFFTSIFQINKIMGQYFYLTYYASIIISVIHIIICLYLPESPKWLYSKTGNKEKTEKALKSIRRHGYDVNEFEELCYRVDEEKKATKMSLTEFLKTKEYLPVTLIASFVNLAQQISGINAIVAFTSSILQTANIGEPDESTLIIIGVGLLGSIIFSPMVTKFPRKIMLTIGHTVMSISFAILMIIIYYEVMPEIQILFYALFMFIFQCGPGPLAWFISVEIFPASSVGAAQGVMTTANWFGNTMVYLLFPIINGKLGSNVLFIFVGINIMISIIFAIFLVETKGKTPERVLSEYRSRFKSLGITY